MNSSENNKISNTIEKNYLKNSTKAKILFAGGGTGGHIFPILAISREIKEKFSSLSEADLYFAGPYDESFHELFEKEGIETRKITTGKIRRYSSFSAFSQNIIDLFFKIPLGIIQAFFYIFFLSPDLLITKGGYGSFPVTLAAKILQVPIFLHESDIAPGLVNKIFSRFALEVFVSFPETEYFPVQKMILVGNPIRKSILKVPDEKEIKEKISLIKKKPVVLIIGGSQGSERINNLILGILPQLLSKFQVIHQCGILNSQELIMQTEFLIPKELKKDYYLFPFLSEEQLRCAYHVSDLVVTRAGSSGIFEIAALGKPAVLIPIPESAQNHQLKNAYSYSDFGAGLVIEEKNITPHLFVEKIINLIDNKLTMERMKKRAKSFSRPRSAKIIAEYSFEFLKQYLEE